MTQLAISQDALEFMKRDPDFNPSAKSSPGVADVHVSSASSKPRKPLTFTEAIQDNGPADTELDFDDALKAAGAAEISKTAVTLKPHKDGGAHVPFPYDPQALDKIDPKHVRMFYSALTDQEALPTRRVGIRSLVATQPRVSPDKVADMQHSGYSKLPVVMRNDGKNYLIEGHHRAAASLLDGESAIDVKYVRLAGADETLKDEFGVTFRVAKADEDRQQIFGWASVVLKDGQLVIDKQGDMIMPETLEDAAYDFLLSDGKHGHMHKLIGTGRPIESMVFTLEKQKALDIVVKDQDGHQIVGWWLGFQVDDPNVWAMHKRGELPDFSIGGLSNSIEIDD